MKLLEFVFDGPFHFFGALILLGAVCTTIVRLFTAPFEAIGRAVSKDCDRKHIDDEEIEDV